MSETDREREGRETDAVTISDKRHARDIDAASEEEGQAAEDTQSVSEEAVTATEPEETGPPPQAAEPIEPSAEQGTDAPQPDAQAAQAEAAPREAAQLRMLFEAGIIGYLHGQLDLLLTFALIYLGRRPNPATGLVATDLDKARLVIDLVEFIAARTQQELSEQDRAGLASLISGLKMEFAQAAQEAPKGPAEGEGEA